MRFAVLIFTNIKVMERIAGFCALHRKSKDLCPMPNIREQEILMAFLSMYNKLLDNIDSPLPLRPL